MVTKKEIKEDHLVDAENIRDGMIPGIKGDKLNFEKLAKAFPSVIKHYDKPLTIGIFGNLGSGKSSFLKMIEESLGKKITKFEAWKYRDSDTLWRSFLLQVGKDMGKKQEVTQALEKLYSSTTKNISHKAIDGPFAICLLFLVLTPFFGDKEVVIGYLSSFIALLLAIYKFYEMQISQKTHSPPVALLEFEREFKEILPSKKNAILHVAIENIDRCDPKEAIELLKNLRSFFYDEDDSKFNVVFFVLCDGDVLKREIEKIYGDNNVSAEEYLSKIIEIPFLIPESDLEAKRKFVDSLLAKSPEKTWHGGRYEVIKNVTGILEKMDINNPREIKRIFRKWELSYQFLKAIKARGKVYEILLLFLIISEEKYKKYFLHWQKLYFRPSSETDFSKIQVCGYVFFLLSSLLKEGNDESTLSTIFTEQNEKFRGLNYLNKIIHFNAHITDYNLNDIGRRHAKLIREADILPILGREFSCFQSQVCDLYPEVMNHKLGQLRDYFLILESSEEEINSPKSTGYVGDSYVGDDYIG